MVEELLGGFGGFASRFGAFAIGVTLLWVARKAHNDTGGRVSPTAMQTLGVILAFLAGCALLVTFIGSWASSLAAAVPWLPVVATLVVAAIILFDWLNDGRPDRPAFFAMLLAPFVITLGIGQAWDAVSDQIGDGADQVTTQIEQAGD